MLPDRGVIEVNLQVVFLQTIGIPAMARERLTLDLLTMGFTMSDWIGCGERTC